MVFVLVNAHEPLNPLIGICLRVAAVLGLVSVIVMWVVTVGRARTAGGQADGIPGPAGNMFSRGYLVVVAAEAILLFGGIALLNAWGQPPQMNVAWVAVVVGVHFIALAPIWKHYGIMMPGVILTVFGLAGFIMAATSAITWVPFVSGVLSGVTLLAGSIYFARRGMA
ncbi:hypothetical protein [Streptosporangium sp. KLBMP 9127]|nr:hypothetical protein [Streptosporangium sp. KLBMP 9127]